MSAGAAKGRGRRPDRSRGQRDPRPSFEELYEQTKRVLRSVHPDRLFLLVCHHCGTTWPDDAEMGMVQTHFQISHDAQVKADGEVDLELDLVYIGEGEPPPPGETGNAFIDEPGWKPRS